MTRQRSALPELLEAAGYLLVLLLLLLFSEAWLPRLFSSETDLEGSAFLRYMWLPAYLAIFLFGLSCWKDMLRTVIRMPFLVSLMLISLASFLWSIDPALTQRRSVAVTFTTLFGVFLAVRYDWRSLLILLGILWLVLGIGNFISGAATPSFGIMSELHTGAWRGLWWEKNELGGQMSRAAFLMAFLMIVDKDHRRLWIGALLLCAALVLLSTSKTALLGMLLGFGILVIATWMRRGAGDDNHTDLAWRDCRRHRHSGAGACA